MANMRLVLGSFKDVMDTLSTATVTLRNVILVTGLLKMLLDFHQNHTLGHKVQAPVTRLQ